MSFSFLLLLEFTHKDEIAQLAQLVDKQSFKDAVPHDICLHWPVLLIRLFLQDIHKQGSVSACLGFLRSHGYRAAESRHTLS